MPATESSLPEDYFNEVYRDNNDPWEFETSNYERDKYAATINALPKDFYNQAFEIGCSIGVLTKMLADKCGHLLSIDIADAPLEKAKERLRNFPNVQFEKMAVPAGFPDKNFDLIVMSEVGYFLSVADLVMLKEKIVTHLNNNGNLLLVHWTPFVPDFPLTGDIVHYEFLRSAIEGLELKHLVHKREDTYRLDLFVKG